MPAEEKDVNEPAMPRRRKRPLRYEDGSAGDFPCDIKSVYRPMYFEALDLAFKQGLTSLDIGSTQSWKNFSEYEEEKIYILDFYKDDFNDVELSLQLTVMSTNLPVETSSTFRRHDLD